MGLRTVWGFSVLSKLVEVLPMVTDVLCVASFVAFLLCKVAPVISQYVVSV